MEDPLIQRHLDDCALANMRPRSIVEREASLRRAAAAIGKPLIEATKDDLRAWQIGLLRLTPSSRATELSHVSVYLKWCVRNEHRVDDPTLTLIRPKNLHGHKRDPMSEADFARALRSAPQPERAWLALAGFCGLRCMEIAGLERKHVRDGQSHPSLSIRGKGDKDRTVYVPAVVLDELRAAGLPKSGTLWEGVDGKPGAPTAARVSRRINSYLRRIGIRETAHTLRHRFGTELYDVSHDPLMVAEQMGHASVDSTRIYVKSKPSSAAAHVEAISKLHGE